MNQAVLMGRLTKDPEVRTTQGGRTIAHYTLAVDRKGDKGETDFIRCVAWEKAAVFAQNYLKKGQRILVSGRIQTGSYQKNGETVYTTDVVVFSQEFADSKTSQAPEPEPEPSGGFSTDVFEALLPWN